MTKFHLITFAGGNVRYKNAQNRLVKQALRFDFFESITSCSQNDLDKNFVELFGDITLKYDKGFGLWAWKPWIINRQIKKLDIGDVLLYLDVGFEINIKAKANMSNYINLLQDKKFVAFDNGHMHHEYTKPDDRILSAKNRFKPQVSAALIALVKCEKTETIVEEWLKRCSINQGELLKEDFYEGSEKRLFAKHRHDQSILTAVLYEMNYEPFSPDPTFSTNWKNLKDSPFINFRNYSSRPLINLELSYGIKGKFIYLVRKFLLTIRFRKFEARLKTFLFNQKS